ncbi:MAG: RnfABCDGE type electron transport complex subunit B [Methylotetracoccus sp.]
MLPTLTVFVSFVGILAALRFAARRAPITSEELAVQIDALLPQTQCGRCGFAGCRPYADAIAAGTADIDRCPPGGDRGVATLAAFLGREPKPVDPGCGECLPDRIVTIEEADCIGCTRCIQACPVDAIVGAPKLMHTVLTAECTGCMLCLPPCPVDCIRIVPSPVVSDDAGEVRSRSAPYDAVSTADRPAMPMPGLLGVMSAPGASGALPCIRCGDCVDACPVGLFPQQLHAAILADDLARADAYRLIDCTTCGACDAACPSRIELVSEFRAAQHSITSVRRERERADIARSRFNARQARLAAEERQRIDDARRRKEALARPGAGAITDAIERARARRRGVAPAVAETPDAAPARRFES